MNIPPKDTILKLLLGMILLLLPGGQAWADLYSYDLDSLVQMSSDIVEARLVLLNRQPIHSPNEWRGFTEDLDVVEVLTVYKGTLHAGDKIAVADVSLYRKAGKVWPETSDIAPGERMVLFLSPGQFRTQPGFAVDSPVYNIMPSGLKLIDGDTVISFEQEDNPGPYVGIHHTKASGITDPAVKDFPGMIEGSKKTVETLAARFATKPSPQDVPWLLQLLRERPPGRGFDDRDFFKAKAADRLASLHDFGVLLEALEYRLDADTHAVLGDAFGSPEGREFILQKLKSDTVPLEKKYLLGQLLGMASRGYCSVTFTMNLSSKESSKNGTAKPDDQAAYQSRIAQLALDFRESPRLCEALVRTIPLYGSRESFQLYPQRKPDAEKACALLKQLHRETTDAKVKSEIENTYASVLGKPLRE